MGDNNEEIALTDVVVAQPTVADQNELVMQLMQQIAEMRVEMQRSQDLPNLIFSVNPPGDGRPPLHFPPPSMEQLNEQNGVDAEKFEDYNQKITVPKHLVEEFRQFEIHEEPNLEEIGIVNQENDECIKEIKIGAYMTKAQESELISLLRERIDTFV
uniref:Uncharacterized protein n=1 Tax=Solanum tuberosum TaxID=4113 RepID=M1DJC9_SOLTU